MTSYSQSFSCGLYKDNFGSSIKINEDGTFKYIWRFDLSMNWTKGTWIKQNDTLCFYMTPILDTLTIKTPEGLAVDTLILSEDEISNRIQYDYNLPVRQYSSQNNQSYPKKLFFKKGKLYHIENGSLMTRKIKGVMTNKQYVPWFYKSDR